MRSVSDSDRSLTTTPGRATEAPTSDAKNARSSLPNHVKHSGMHNRRDKRYPFRSGRIRPEDLAEVEAFEAAQEDAPTAGPIVEDWQEAIMLWLSWNSTYEKVLAKMCKPGQNQQKLESMMDEMDQLRKRAIAKSERVLSAESACPPRP